MEENIDNNGKLAQESPESIKSSADRGGGDGGGGGGPPVDDERCERNDGKQWRCRSRKVEGQKMCFQHLNPSKRSKIVKTPKLEEREVECDEKVLSSSATNPKLEDREVEFDERVLSSSSTNPNLEESEVEFDEKLPSSSSTNPNSSELKKVKLEEIVYSRTRLPEIKETGEDKSDEKIELKNPKKRGRKKLDENKNSDHLSENERKVQKIKEEDVGVVEEERAVSPKRKCRRRAAKEAGKRGVDDEQEDDDEEETVSRKRRGRKKKRGKKPAAKDGAVKVKVEVKEENVGIDDVGDEKMDDVEEDDDEEKVSKKRRGPKKKRGRKPAAKVAEDDKGTPGVRENGAEKNVEEGASERPRRSSSRNAAAKASVAIAERKSRSTKPVFDENVMRIKFD